MSALRIRFAPSLSAYLLILVAGCLMPRIAVAQTLEVVNMIPATLSNETNQDSEPDLTVNPNNPNEIVASAFTPNPTGATSTAPVYISQDGGNSWVLNNIVPSTNGSTGDITVSLSRNNVLYAGILRGGAGVDMRILRSSTYTGAGTMTQLLGRFNEDQPYIRAYSPMGGPQRNKDHLYVGHNDFNNLPRSASLEQSLNAQTTPAPAGLGTVRLERRTPAGQDGPPIRPAIHADGTVYAVYTQRTASVGTVRTGNIVVVRDDNWGQGANPYSDLTDPGDSLPGRLVAAGVNWVWNNAPVLGQERLGDRASIAVDPTDSQTVYVAWADRPASQSGNTATLHVRRSTNGGATWSADLLTINSAPGPQLAVNIRGDVGFLYQQLTGASPNQRWETHFQQSEDGGASWTDFVLANTAANSPAAIFLPYLGDYLGLTAMGKDFLGVFSASNLPNNTNFPQGVTYQRSANFGTNTLDDGIGNPVNISIDPFFFRVENLEADEDFYVRDWSDSFSSNDIGLEPSTDPVFYNSSDVWNRRTNAAGAFNANDRPMSEDPQDSTLGTNYAFARVHRKDTGSAETVSLHFLKSEFGTGSNYQDAGVAADPTLAFGAGDQVLTMTSGYPWSLLATTSSHVCLAVEISTAQDPIVPPGLLGNAPGWPDTDLMVLYDNNKAQRNMGVYVDDGEGGKITYWAVIHNAATFRRDFVLDFEPNPLFLELGLTPTFVSVGREGVVVKRDHIIFPGLAAGENRWLGISIPVGLGLDSRQLAGVDFYETVGGEARNGFTIAVRGGETKTAIDETLRLHIGNLWRLGHLFGREDAAKTAREVARRLEELRDPKAYRDYVGDIFGQYAEWIDEALRSHRDDPFDIFPRLSVLDEERRGGRPSRILPAHSDVEHALDAYLTFFDKQLGDVADIGQTLRWQVELFRTVPALSSLSGAEELIQASEEFVRGFSARHLVARDYPRALEGMLPMLWYVDAKLSLGLGGVLGQLQTSVSAGQPQSAQRFHRDFLLALEELR